MIFISKSVCTDPKEYIAVAKRYSKGIDTLTQILSPPTSHSVQNGLISVPEKLEVEEKEKKQDELISLSYGYFKLSPILEGALDSDTKPLSVDLKGIGSYDLAITPIHFQIKDPAGKSAILDEWDYGTHIPEMPEKHEDEEVWLNDHERAALDLLIADIRNFRKSKAATSINELIKSPNSSAIPTLLITHPSFTLSILTADGWGLKSEEDDEKMGVLNLIVHMLDTAYAQVKTATTLDDDFSRSITVFNLVNEVLSNAINDPNGRVSRNAYLLGSTANRLAKVALQKYTELNSSTA